MARRSDPTGGFMRLQEASKRLSHMTRTDKGTTIAERVQEATTWSCDTTGIIYVTEPGWDGGFAQQGMADHARTGKKRLWIQACCSRTESER